jgi:ethanolamine ammonia-lyase small subunit
MTPLITQDLWQGLRRHTSARIALGRSGGSLTTREILAFAHDHALARDAVHAPFDVASLAGSIRALGPEILVLESAAPDRATYLRRPDLGRQLSPESVLQLSSLNLQPQHDLVVLVSDGLSSLAAQRQAVPVLATLLPLLAKAGWTLAPICVVQHARVALMSELGAILQARLGLILIGERPGLGTPDSLGAYLEFAPEPGHTVADRNCVSNIRPGGLPPDAAAKRIFSLLTAAQRGQRSGILLKDDSGEPDVVAIS